MKQKTKVLTILLLSAIAGALLCLPLIQALESNEEMGNEITLAEFQEDRRWRRAAVKVKLAWWFLNHSEPMEVEGTAATLTNNMLVVNTAEDQTRVHLPAEWTIVDEVIPREELVASHYISGGEYVSVKSLEANLINKEGHRIYLLIGYEIINDLGIHAYANLRVNIED